MSYTNFIQTGILARFGTWQSSKNIFGIGSGKKCRLYILNNQKLLVSWVDCTNINNIFWENSFLFFAMTFSTYLGQHSVAIVIQDGHSLHRVQRGFLYKCNNAIRYQQWSSIQYICHCYDIDMCTELYCTVVAQQSADKGWVQGLCSCCTNT